MSISVSSGFSMERKYRDDDSNGEYHPLTWIISSDNKRVVEQGQLPAPGSIRSVILIDEETKQERFDDYYVEKLSAGGYDLFRMKNEDGRRVRDVIYRLRPETIVGTFKEAWDKLFKDDTRALENVNILDEMMAEWDRNEVYVEIDLPISKHSNSDARGASSRKGKKVIMRQQILKTVQDKLYVAKGKIQSCKTNFMMDGALKQLERGRSSVIIFQRIGHMTQFKERFEARIKKDKAAIQATGHEIPFPIEYVVASKENFSADSFFDALQGKPAKIFLIIANDNQMGNLNHKFETAVKALQDCIENSFVLWIDEADYVDSGTDAKKTECLKAIKNYAYAIVEVSATVLDIVGREDVVPDHLKMLSAPTGYRGVPSFDTEKNITSQSATYCSRINDDLLVQDKGLRWVIDQFLKDKPMLCAAYHDYHPRIMLVNNGRTVKPQQKLLHSLKSEGTDMALMVYTGEGIQLYHHSLPDSEIEINGIRSKVVDHVHLFDGITPSSALLWLKQHGGYRTFHHILIAAGDLAGRSISYGCFDPEARGKLPYWHLTHHRLVLPPTCACPDVEQRMRLCTTFDTPVPLKLYASQDDMDAVIKAYWSQEELLERGKAHPNQQYLHQIMAQLKLCSSKIPIGRSLTKDAKLKVCKRVKKNDGGLSLSSYVFDGKYDHERVPISDKLPAYMENEQKGSRISELKGVKAPLKDDKKWYKIYTKIKNHLKIKPNIWVLLSDIVDPFHDDYDRVLKFNKTFGVAPAGHSRIVFRNHGSETSPRYEYMYSS